MLRLTWVVQYSEMYTHRQSGPCSLALHCRGRCLVLTQHCSTLYMPPTAPPTPITPYMPSTPRPPLRTPSLSVFFSSPPCMPFHQHAYHALVRIRVRLGRCSRQLVPLPSHNPAIPSPMLSTPRLPARASAPCMPAIPHPPPPQHVLSDPAFRGDLKEVQTLRQNLAGHSGRGLRARDVQCTQ